jgi:hypothetical protein
MIIPAMHDEFSDTRVFVMLSMPSFLAKLDWNPASHSTISEVMATYSLQAWNHFHLIVSSACHTLAIW